ncbi:hypothetical protein MPNT_200010 [Candidatus Methylacidithermus pantelleriae]|uniref:Uncharacterized protein n=1 Tax=Candidatus Methylacidithermus pantelleriae TaxID=2744239 RepID=A0A8J2FPD7_9BACT|nr:hypothetical protein MPNT_200010 [Candidatus Methylacidithermus pantelleriae]
MASSALNNLQAGYSQLARLKNNRFREAVSPVPVDGVRTTLFTVRQPSGTSNRTQQSRYHQPSTSSGVGRDGYPLDKTRTVVPDETPPTLRDLRSFSLQGFDLLFICLATIHERRVHASPLSQGSPPR